MLNIISKRQKMLNIISKRQKQKYRRDVIALMNRLESILLRSLKPLINGQFINSANIVQNGSEDIDQSIDNQSAKLRQLFRIHYLRAGGKFSKETFKELRNLKSFIAYQKKGIEDDFAEDEFVNVLNGFIEQRVAEKITLINNTTKKTVKRIIEKAREEGLTNREIAKKIRKVGNIASLQRAIKIARTETHTVGNFATDTVIQQSGFKTEKEWVAALDDRTRDPHADVNGQRVPKEEPFIVDGEELDYPGDPNGSPGNIINCRCVSIYHIV